MADVSYCNIKGGYPGEGNIDSNPQFTSCAFSEYYLSDGSNGHPLSPCIDSGSDLASNITYEQISNSINMDEWTADSSWSSDVGMVDMGFHWNHSFYNGVKLDLSETLFYPGDTFSLVTAVINHSDETWDNACLFVALEIEGSYWLAPSWQPASHGIDYYTLSLFNGDHTVIPVLEAFSWPEGLGTLSGIAFHGLLTDTAIVSLLGEMDTVYFGYTE